ncbi:MAG TPA: hypothetical protein VKK79_06295 [Candidatus Lokiarchaeia archaeon]|nr:hypothetical protein [Candidatus Lokiarchaeia archaeon]
MSSTYNKVGNWVYYDVECQICNKLKMHQIAPGMKCGGCNRMGCNSCINKWGYCATCWASLTPAQQTEVKQRVKTEIRKTWKVTLRICLPFFIVIVVGFVLLGLRYPAEVWGTVLGVGFAVAFLIGPAPIIVPVIRRSREEQRKTAAYNKEHNIPEPAKHRTPNRIKFVLILVIVVVVVVVVVGILLALPYFAELSS